MNCEAARIAVLAAVWLAYGVFALFSGFFDASYLRYSVLWEEKLRHTLSMLGYGTIGCWFYVLTGRDGDHFERMCWATLWSAGFFVAGLLVLWGTE